MQMYNDMVVIYLYLHLQGSTQDQLIFSNSDDLAFFWFFLINLLYLTLCLNIISHHGSADLRSPEKEVYFRSWDFAHHQIYKSIFDAQKLIKKT